MEIKNTYIFAPVIAKVAQLVEHNLAKVRVAGSSPVFRSQIIRAVRGRRFLYNGNAQVAELVDAHVSGACVARRAGSSPVLGTIGADGEIGRHATLRGVVPVTVCEFESHSAHIYFKLLNIKILFYFSCIIHINLIF